jgi:hypothetical protein
MLVVAISAVLFWSTKDLSWVSLSADARRYASGAVTADAIAALWILIGVAGTAASLAAGPAFARFLRAGGWPEVRWQVARAAGVTAAAAVALTRLHLLERSMTFEQAPGSAAYLGWFFAALALLWAMLLLWRQAAMTVAARLELSPRVRAAQIVLYAVTTTAAFAIPSVAQIWIGQIKPDNWMLGTGALWLIFFFRSEPARLWWAWHRAKQLRAAAE